LIAIKPRGKRKLDRVAVSTLPCTETPLQRINFSMPRSAGILGLSRIAISLEFTTCSLIELAVFGLNGVVIAVLSSQITVGRSKKKRTGT
jgi:hypothetical protein